MTEKQAIQAIKDGVKLVEISQLLGHSVEVPLSYDEAVASLGGKEDPRVKEAINQALKEFGRQFKD